MLCLGDGSWGFAECLLAASCKRRLVKAVDFQEGLLDGLCYSPLSSCLRYALATMKLSGEGWKLSSFPHVER